MAFSLISTSTARNNKLFKFSNPLHSKMSSWSCKKCTFINPSSRSQNPTCQICLSPPSPSPSPSKPDNDTNKWSCKACTFLNPYNVFNCKICGTRCSGSSFVDLDDDDGENTVFYPLRACKRKIDELGDGNGDLELGLREAKDDSKKDCDGEALTKLGGFQGFMTKNSSVTVAKDAAKGNDSDGTLDMLKILSYNVWFREDLELHKRMKALGDLIQLHSPDVICFQEVTPNIYDIFKLSSWWKTYCCSVSDMMASRPYFCMQLSKLPVKAFNTMPFSNSIMGRELCIAELEVKGHTPLVVATSHLESPCPAPPKWDQMFSKERVHQAKESINTLKKHPNIIFCGDMNWDDKLDGQFPLPDGWVDAWNKLKPGDNGWTYDTKSNQMLSGNRTLQKRLDRFACHLHDFKIINIDMIGKEAIPGLSYIKEKKVRKEVKTLELPVLPSDHYGLLLTISSQ